MNEHLRLFLFWLGGALLGCGPLIIAIYFIERHRHEEWKRQLRKQFELHSRFGKNVNKQ